MMLQIVKQRADDVGVSQQRALRQLELDVRRYGPGHLHDLYQVRPEVTPEELASPVTWRPQGHPR